MRNYLLKEKELLDLAADIDNEELTMADEMTAETEDNNELINKDLNKLKNELTKSQTK